MKLYTCNTRVVRKKQIGEEKNNSSDECRKCISHAKPKILLPSFLVYYFGMFSPGFHISLCECFKQIV